MKTKIVSSFLLLTGFAAYFYTPQGRTSSTNPPTAHTGAPTSMGTEPTCATQGCHNSFALNSGTGTNTLSLNGGATTYVPGQTYTVTVTAKTTGKTKYGFEATVIKDSDKTKAGTLAAGTGVGIGSGYAYQTNGGNTFASGTATWNFTWTAPATNVGPVTIYAATNHANGSGSTGDYIYTQSLKLNPSVSTGITENSAEATGLTLFPNPSKGQFQLAFQLNQPSEVRISLLDVTGKEVAFLLKEQANAGLYTRNLETPALSSGVYFVKIESADGVQASRLMIQ